MHVTRIRPATADEAALVLDVWRRAGSDPSPTDSVEHVGAVIARGDGSLLLAERDGEVVGTLIVGWDGWRGTFYRLAVVPAHRRAGIGRALVDEGERLLRERGARRVGAIVLSGHPDAIGFWESAGYELHAEARRHRKLL